MGDRIVEVNEERLVVESKLGVRYELTEVKRHGREGSHSSYLDGCDCCGKTICRMCDKHIDDIEEDDLDELETKRIPIAKED